MILKLQFLIRSSYHIVPSFSTETKRMHSFIVMITKAKQTKVLIYLFFRFRRHHIGHECQRQSPSTLVRHDQESRPSPCQDPLLECQLHRLIDTTNCYYIYFFSLHATLCHNVSKAYIKSHFTLHTVFLI